MENFWIDPFLYVQIYQAVLAFTVIFILTKQVGYSLDNINRGAVLLALFIIIYWAVRPISHLAGLVDTKAAATFFNLAKEYGSDVLGYKDLGYVILVKTMLPFTVEAFFGVLACLYIITYLVAYKNIYSSNFGIAFIILVCSFSFFGYGVNGMRNGIALAFVTLAISNLNRKLWQTVLMCIIGLSFHKSALLPICAFVLVRFYNKPKVYMGVWFACLLLSLVLGNFLASLIPADLMREDDRLSSYLTADFADQQNATFSYIGFRFDFLFYSMIPIIVGWKYMKKLESIDTFYLRVWSTYVICNAFWILTIYVPYNNRFAYLSWFLFPILVTYPFVKEKTRLTRNIHSVLFLNYLFMFLMWLKE